ncbi:hypothetical protein QTP88_028709 [Uroleucon formosanum]
MVDEMSYSEIMKKQKKLKSEIERVHKSVMKKTEENNEKKICINSLNIQLQNQKLYNEKLVNEKKNFGKSKENYIDELNDKLKKKNEILSKINIQYEKIQRLMAKIDDKNEFIDQQTKFTNGNSNSDHKNTELLPKKLKSEREDKYYMSMCKTLMIEDILSNDLNVENAKKLTEENIFFSEKHQSSKKALKKALDEVELWKYRYGSYFDECYDGNDKTKILKVLTNLWSPQANYLFPLLNNNAKRNIKFQQRWLDKFNWLSYSEKLEGAFKYCVVFAKSGGKGSQALGSLVKHAFQNWKKALEVFEKHSKHEYHTLSLLKSEQFLKSFSSGQPSIIDILDTERMKQKKENRLNLLPIIECVMLCGRQELALRGHKDAGPICFKTESEPYINEGNFRAILKYKAKDLNHLKHFLESDGRYKYTSAKIQNEIISSAGDILLEKIVKEVNSAKCFSVLADETTDISVKEQLALCVRYVVGSDENVFVCERFLKYIEIYSLTGKDIASTIVNGLNSCGIDCSNMYGQGYDGASNMSGRFKGTQKIVRETCPKALYVHCAAHSLNLAVSTSCDIQAIRNSLGLVEKMYCFLNTPKHKNVLLSVINESDMDTRSKSIKHLCATRWVERYTAINDFVELFPYVIQTLEKICEWNDTTLTDANILMKAMDSEFLISLQVIKVLFSYGLPLCKLLQKVNLDLKEAVDLAEVTVATIQRLRGNITEEFKQLFKEAEKMANILDITISIKRLSKKCTKRANPSINDPEEYYRVTIAIPYIDSFIQQLNERFLCHKNVLKGFQCLFSGTYSDDFDELLQFYLDTDKQIVKAELNLWHAKEMFPNLHFLVQILCSLPVSTATPERTFSCLKRLKTYLRNTMTETRLNGLTMLAVHTDIPLSAEEVLDELAKKPRKLDFVL